MIDLRGRGGGGGANIKKNTLKFKNQRNSRDFSYENELVIVLLQKIRLRNKKKYSRGTFTHKYNKNK